MSVLITTHTGRGVVAYAVLTRELLQQKNYEGNSETDEVSGAEERLLPA